MTDPLNGRGHPTPEYAFKVKLVAVVRVRAANETVARRVLPSVLSSPGTVDIKVANENNAALGVDALVTDVDFAIEESAALFEVDGTIIKHGLSSAAVHRCRGCADVDPLHSTSGANASCFQVRDVFSIDYITNS